MQVNWAAVARRTQTLARALQVDDVLSQALDGGDEIGADGAAVWLFDRSSYRLELATERGLDTLESDSGHRPEWPGLFKIPLSSAGALGGVIEFYTRAAEGFSEDQHCAFTILGAAVAGALQRSHEVEQLRQAREEAAALGAVDALQTIVQSLPQGVVLLDPAGHVLLANRNGGIYLERLSDEQDPVLTIGSVPLTVLQGEAFASGIDLCVREVELRSGERSWHYSVTVVPVHENRSLLGTVLSIEDVSERRLTEQRLFHDARLASIGEFASGLAHELNNPMMIVLGVAEMLRDDPSLGADKRGILEAAAQAAVRAAEIVKQMTTFTDTQQERGWDALNLRDVLSEAMSLVETRCAGSNIFLVTEWDENLPPVYGQAGKLQQLVLDLINNAHEALVQSGVGTRICVRGRAVDSEVWIDVEDNGPGVPADIRDNIFDLFFSTKREHQGKGLGLSVAHRTAVEHRGALTLEPVAEGALFRLRLPQHKWASQ
ncbi:MAG: hypothetical protein HZB16_13145 [Armatimonadetes bacterium]|nr:hypothetical protein [Armatimonadota bacterium]